MALEHGRRRVVAGDHDDVGLERQQLGNVLIDFLNDGHLAGKVAIFAGRVCALDVHEEEVELS